MPQTIRRDDISNGLLRALPQQSLERVTPYLERSPLDRGQMIHQPGVPVARVYFVESGLVALVKSMRDGRSAMVGTCGTEGMTAPAVPFDAAPVNVETIVQVPGTALILETKTLRALLSEDEPLKRLLTLYGSLVVDQFVRHSACNRLHSLEQRCAKLLLTCYDNVPSESFEMTQEFLAMTLGVQRSRISVVASLFQRASLIEYRHGHMRIADPAGLEALCCECYEANKANVENLIGRRRTAD